MFVVGPARAGPLPRCKRRARRQAGRGREVAARGNPVGASAAPEGRDAVPLDLAIEGVAADTELRRDTAHVAMELLDGAQQRGALGRLQAIARLQPSAAWPSASAAGATEPLRRGARRISHGGSPSRISRGRSIARAPRLHRRSRAPCESRCAAPGCCRARIGEQRCSASRSMAAGRPLPVSPRARVGSAAPCRARSRRAGNSSVMPFSR